MKLAFATTFDSRDINKWSGTPLHMVNAFLQQEVAIERIGGLTRHLPPFFKIKQFWKKIAYGQRESPRFNIVTAKKYSDQIINKIQHLDVDAIIAPQINPISYLDSKLPQILWTDSLYANLLDSYPSFANHSTTTINQGHTLVKECLSRCRLAIFSSNWAAQTALRLYGANQDKVKVVPFGANISYQFSLEDIRRIIKNRSRHTCKLLFIGKYWERKGGDIVFKVVNTLHQAGHSVELNFLGCNPPKNVKIPHYIKCHGFISKSTPEGMKKIINLFQDSHLLFVPSRAEAYGIVFCEANAFGLPCLASNVGGISTIVKNGINGMTFESNARIEDYCNYILELMQNYSHYEDLALSSFNEYQTRLNWNVATQTVKKLINEVI